MKAVPEILIVDDSVAMQKQLANLLQKKNASVTCVGSGEEALKLLHGKSFNLVLSDVILTGMSGLQLLKMIKEINPETEVIIITGNASSYTAIKALRLGAYDFIVKPIDDEAILYNVVERTLEKQALAIENQRLISDLSVKNRELQEALEMMKTVNRVCAHIAETHEIGEILRMLVESAVEQIKATRGYLLLQDKQSDTFYMKVSVGIEQALAKKFNLNVGRGISGLVAAKNRPLRLGNDIPPSITPRMFEEDPNGELYTSPGLLSVPLCIKDKVVGVVNVSGRASGTPFTSTEMDFLSTLATHAAIAINNAGALYRLQKSGQ